MDEVAVVAYAGLEESVVHVVLEVDRLAIGRILVAGAMQVGHSADVLGEHRRQADRDGVLLERGQGIVADVEIPQAR